MANRNHILAMDCEDSVTIISTSGSHRRIELVVSFATNSTPRHRGVTGSYVSTGTKASQKHIMITQP